VGNFGNAVSANELAVSVARTAAFFSNGEAPLSSRTVRFISGIHFPPGVTNKPPAALYGIENTNRGCALNPALDAVIPRATSIAGGACTGGAVGGCGSGIVTGKADLFDSNPFAVNGGGVPIFKDGQVAGGIGVAGVGLDAAEFAAFMGSIAGGARFGPRVPDPGAIFLDGIQLPFVWILMACLGGFEVLGLVGLVVGPVVLALAKELWDQRIRDLDDASAVAIPRPISSPEALSA